MVTGISSEAEIRASVLTFFNSEAFAQSVKQELEAGAYRGRAVTMDSIIRQEVQEFIRAYEKVVRLAQEKGLTSKEREVFINFTYGQAHEVVSLPPRSD